MRELYVDELELELVDVLLPLTDAEPFTPAIESGPEKLVLTCPSIRSASAFRYAKATFASASVSIAAPAARCFGSVPPEAEHPIRMPTPPRALSARNARFMIASEMSRSVRSGAKCSVYQETRRPVAKPDSSARYG